MQPTFEEELEKMIERHLDKTPLDHMLEALDHFVDCLEQRNDREVKPPREAV